MDLVEAEVSRGFSRGAQKLDQTLWSSKNYVVDGRWRVSLDLVKVHESWLGYHGHKKKERTRNDEYR
uniref:Putative ovule protein n=1 Tax=Solanum chacoense TaxID=4108 RepID=A0A0V0GSA5_SOLCH